jgi:hypothetical protein
MSCCYHVYEPEDAKTALKKAAAAMKVVNLMVRD